jgi:hypothetical protein
MAGWSADGVVAGVCGTAAFPGDGALKGSRSRVATSVERRIRVCMAVDHSIDWIGGWKGVILKDRVFTSGPRDRARIATAAKSKQHRIGFFVVFHTLNVHLTLPQIFKS